MDLQEPEAELDVDAEVDTDIDAEPQSDLEASLGRARR
jgi:hypothetical protein